MLVPIKSKGKIIMQVTHLKRMSSQHVLKTGWILCRQLLSGRKTSRKTHLSSTKTRGCRLLQCCRGRYKGDLDTVCQLVLLILIGLPYFHRDIESWAWSFLMSMYQGDGFHIIES